MLWKEYLLSRATVPQIAELFLYQQRELKLSVFAVEDYWATLNHVFSLAGTGLAPSKVISRMFSNFEKICPLRKVKSPEWNLSLVLRNLTCQPYEILKLPSDKHLTWKTCILLALASAKRVSEFHGIGLLLPCMAFTGMEALHILSCF